MFLDISFLLPTHKWRQSGQTYWKDRFLTHHTCSRNTVVGYLTIITYWVGRQRCCRWCLDMFLEYKKAFFAQHMNNGKVIGLIENSNFLKFHICYKNKVVGYPKIIKNSAGSVLWCLDMFSGYKNLLLPIYERRKSRRHYWKKKLFDISHLL